MNENFTPEQLSRNGKKRWANVSKTERSKICRAAAMARWAKTPNKKTVQPPSERSVNA
jgi:hypothetical protein